MSIANLLLAVRNHVRTISIHNAPDPDYANKDCEVMEDGKPPPRCGLFFVAVHPGGPVQDKEPYNFDESYSVTITITRRYQGPLDRQGLKATADAETLKRAAEIRQEMKSKMYAIMNAANTLIFADTSKSVGGFIEPLQVQSMDSKVTKQNSDWFSGKGGEAGCSVEIRLSGARRIQTSGSAT